MPLEDNQIGFFTVYDGSFDKYIADFTKNIGEIFDLLFKFTKGAPPSPCRKHLQEFIDFAAGANRAPIGFYQAYPGLSGSGHPCTDRRQQVAIRVGRTSTPCWASAIFRLRPRSLAQGPNRRNLLSQDNKSLASQAKKVGGRIGRLFGHGDAAGLRAEKSTLDLADIQGFILRGYRMPMVRHFLLAVGVPAEARKLLGRFVSGDESDAPQITTAEDWHVGFEPGPADNPADAPRRKPDYCLNVGITWPGMVALEIKRSRACTFLQVLSPHSPRALPNARN